MKHHTGATMKHLPTFARADALRELLDDELAAALASAAADPVAIDRAELLAASRAARLVVPDLFAADPCAATDLVHAMAYGTEDDFRYLLHQACTSGLTVWAAETALEAPVVDAAPDGVYLAPAGDTNTSPANDRPRVKRAYGTVRGRGRRSVVGDDRGIPRELRLVASGAGGAHDARDVAAMCDAYCAMFGIDLDPMIGTDDYAWQEVHHEARLVTSDDMGDSLVGRGDRRVRLASRGTTVRYRHTDGGYVTTVTYPRSVTATPVTVRHPRVTRTRAANPAGDPRYVYAYAVHDSAVGRTASYVTVRHDRSRFTGRGRAERLAPTRDRKASTPRPVTVVLAHEIAADRIAADLEAMHGSGTTASRRYDVPGIGLVTVRHDHTRRTYRVTLTTTDPTNGKRVSRKLTDTRSTHTALAAIARATVAA